jgi:hypothetical protein
MLIHDDNVLTTIERSPLVEWYGREITYGTERITERKSYGTGEARTDDDTDSELPAGTAGNI